jgi:hypothetical protein
MDTSSRRAFLQAVVEAEDSSTRDRLKAAELLAELDRYEAERPQREPEPIEDPVEKIQRTFELAVEHGLFDVLPQYRERVEREAERIIEERAQATLAQMRCENDADAE